MAVGLGPSKLPVGYFYSLLFAALGYFLAIKSKLESIEVRNQEQTLLNEFKEKDSKLRNLQQLQTQLQQMEADFTQQLQQLLKETEIPGLLRY